MSRSVSWRRVCTDHLSILIDKSLQSTLYILNETGPTGFLIKQDGGDKKFKVLLGDPHTCTCSQFRRTKELCVHILWLMLKKFRVPKDNSLIYQLGLVEREIQEVLSGRLIYQVCKQTDDIPQETCNTSCDQRSITNEDVCPICQESLIDRRLTYCKYGCGNNVHLKCIKMWADYQKSEGEQTINCPLCREKFSTFKELYNELHCSKGKRILNTVGKEPLHLGVTCEHCHICPVAGKCFKCDTCSADYFLCSNCYNSADQQQHCINHSFVFRQHPSHPWRTATIPSQTVTIPSQTVTIPSQYLIDELQQRELSETDYELLLRLDNNSSIMRGAPSLPITSTVVPRHVLNSLHTEPLDNDHRLIKLKRSCSICSEKYQRGDWIRKLSCKHKFHRQCIDQKLGYDLSGNIICPIDGKIIIVHTNRSTHVTSKGSHSKLARTTTTNNDNTQDSNNILVTGRGLMNSFIETTPISLRPTAGSICRGLMHTSTKTRSGSDSMSLNVQATPISACSNASSERDILSSNESSANQLSTRRHPPSTVAKKYGRHNNLLPKIQSPNHVALQFNNALLISTIDVHVRDDKLPLINAHLNKKTSDS